MAWPLVDVTSHEIDASEGAIASHGVVASHDVVASHEVVDAHGVVDVVASHNLYGVDVASHGVVDVVASHGVDVVSLGVVDVAASLVGVVASHRVVASREVVIMVVVEAIASPRGGVTKATVAIHGGVKSLAPWAT